MRSAPTLNSWMTPFSSVAMLEKLALLKIAFCSAPVFSRAASRPTSVTPSAAAVSMAPTVSSEMAGSRDCADMRCLLHGSRQCRALFYAAPEHDGDATVTICGQVPAGGHAFL